MFSTRDFSTTLLQTSGEVPTQRLAHGAALIGTTLLICGGKTNFHDQNGLNHESLYLLNLGTSDLLMSISREWTRVVVNGPGLNGRYDHTTTVVGSKLFVFSGQIGENFFNDMWTLDWNRLKSQPLWESYEPTPGNKKPLPRARHVSVTTEDRIIIFGGYDGQHYYNDTWSFDISTRKWTELQCTGSIPSPRAGHAAVLVDDVMYVFGGFSTDEGYLDDLYALQLSTQRWFKCHNLGLRPRRRAYHAMASDGTRVFVLGGYSAGAQSDEISLIHTFDASMYFRPVISSELPPRLRTQRTSSTRNPSVTLSFLMRRPPKFRGSHPQVPRPKNNHSPL
ncbi:galactose oxidase [Russula emetica]|nr:galactose oxidase [Russula emetica]